MSDEVVQDVHETTCCIVGGGPAGMILGLLLARKGVPVTVLESHPDFDRDFRGDTVHPSTLEVMDKIGLIDKVLAIPHGKIDAMWFNTPQGIVKLISFANLPTRYPYVATIPQVKFLDLLAEEAKVYPSFDLRMLANVQRLVQENGAVKGVRYRDKENQWHEVRAHLTIGADGRFSRIRSLLEFKPIASSVEMDVMWFRLPRQAGDKCENGEAFIGFGPFIIVLDRDTEWQMGLILPKGGFQQVRAAGLDAFRQNIARAIPWIANRVDQLQDWKQITLLSVESSYLEKWHQPGVLLIGDAAHVMSPIGGVGINSAIQDSIACANELTKPLLEKRVEEKDLEKIQRMRLPAVRIVQRLQALIQNIIVKEALDPKKPFKMPLAMRLLPHIPIVRNIPAKVFALGPSQVHYNDN